MGFLEIGTPLEWNELKQHVKYIKFHGISQLIHIWNLNKDRFDEDVLYWGEELEFSLVNIDSSRCKSQVYSGAAEILEELNVRDKIQPRRLKSIQQLSCQWHPEFGNHMIEAVPSPPYFLNANSIISVEPSMRLRRAKIQSILNQNKFVTSQTAFPRFGLKNFVNYSPQYEKQYYITDSIFVPDNVINPHPRYGSLVSNSRSRRGAKPFILIPIYQDKMTGKSPEYTETYCITKTSKNNVSNEQKVCLTENLAESDWSKAKSIDEMNRFLVEKLARETLNPIKNYIYMDSFAFGMGMSCVQTTFSCPNISTARYLYDQLTVLAPLFLALTASTPFQRGLLSDYDTRWSTLEQSVDCRTKEEMLTISKSRYSGVSQYISDMEPLQSNFDYLNDTHVKINEDVYQQLLSNGMDNILARHFAHLWIRDPLVVFAEKIELDDKQYVDHFENIQSTNWNSVRFKPPPLSTNPSDPSIIGWRVEFRSPEIQLTDYDNAAGVALISVLVQAILANKFDFYIPISLNDINMKRSWNRNAINTEKFYFRTDINQKSFNNSKIVEMSLHEILAGSTEHNFIGLISICKNYLNSLPKVESLNQTKNLFNEYTNLYLDRTANRKQTCAQFLRDFVLKHPAYKQNSVISPVICHDLTVLSTHIGFGLWLPMNCYSAYHSIRPTPLLPNIKLPKLSPLGKQIIQISPYSETLLNCTSKELSDNSLLHLLQKPMHILSSGDSLDHTDIMPEGFGNVDESHVALCDNLFSMTLETLLGFSNYGILHKKAASVISAAESENETKFNINRLPIYKADQQTDLSLYNPMSLMHNFVSSEDFTQAWILKGFDCVGGPSDLKCCYGSAKRMLLRDMERKEHSSDETFKVQQSTLHDGDRMSTICPSSFAGETDFETNGFRSTNSSIKFDTDEDFEYYQQVCHASA